MNTKIHSKNDGQKHHHLSSESVSICKAVSHQSLVRGHMRLSILYLDSLSKPVLSPALSLSLDLWFLLNNSPFLVGMEFFEKHLLLNHLCGATPFRKNLSCNFNTLPNTI